MFIGIILYVFLYPDTSIGKGSFSQDCFSLKVLATNCQSSPTCIAGLKTRSMFLFYLDNESNKSQLGSTLETTSLQQSVKFQTKHVRKHCWYICKHHGNLLGKNVYYFFWDRILMLVNEQNETLHRSLTYLHEFIYLLILYVI